MGVSAARAAATCVVVLGALTAFAGCAESPEHQLGEWRLVEGSGPSGPLGLLDDHPVTLELEEKPYRGVAACNHYGGDVSVKSGVWLPSMPEVTAMLCEPSEVMTLETTYLETLLGATAHSVTDDELVLTGPDDVELRFERVAQG